METINPQNLLVKIAAILERLNINYCVTGGIAVSVWGRPRATFDIDVVIEILERQVSLLAKALRKISEITYIDENMAKKAILNYGEFNFIDGKTGFKVDFWVKKDNELSKLQFKRKEVKIISGQRVYFISPEDLILSKLDWYKKSESTRQLEDIESVLKISGKILDKKYLNSWAKKLGFFEILKSIDTSEEI